jgi:ribonuclease R
MHPKWNEEPLWQNERPIKYKQAEYMHDQLGSIHDAVITGVTERGLYAEIIENKIEGMIAMRDLDDDFYVF